MDPDTKVIREPTTAALQTFLTPTEQHYITAHMGIARCSAEGWTVAIDGLVERPLVLTLDELATMPAREVPITLECAGNPLDPDKPLRRVSTARWHGVPLAELLRRARPQPSASHVWLEGADHGTFADTPVDAYRKDLTLDKAYDEDVLVATRMNGAPLPPEHGFPLRVIVPGYYGTNSVKWLRRITVAAERVQGLFTTQLYLREADVADRQVTEPVWDIWVNCRIVEPEPDAQLRVGRHRLKGWAWGAREVAAVEVSSDGGRSWAAARLAPRGGRAWQRFEAVWDAPQPGRYHLCARARDTRGAVQPGDEHINQVHQIHVEATEKQA